MIGLKAAKKWLMGNFPRCRISAAYLFFFLFAHKFEALELRSIDLYQHGKNNQKKGTNRIAFLFHPFEI